MQRCFSGVSVDHPDTIAVEGWGETKDLPMGVEVHWRTWHLLTGNGEARLSQLHSLERILHNRRQLDVNTGGEGKGLVNLQCTRLLQLTQPHRSRTLTRLPCSPDVVFGCLKIRMNRMTLSEWRMQLYKSAAPCP